MHSSSSGGELDVTQEDPGKDRDSINRLTRQLIYYGAANERTCTVLIRTDGICRNTALGVFGLLGAKGQLECSAVISDIKLCDELG